MSGIEENGSNDSQQYPIDNSEVNYNKLQNSEFSLLRSPYISEDNPRKLGGRIVSRDGQVVFFLDRELPLQKENSHTLRIIDIYEGDTDYIVYCQVADPIRQQTQSTLENGSYI